MLDLRVLNYFLTVAREESITRAAEALHLSQPTLSRQLRDMEEMLGKELMIRGPRRIPLTEEGLFLKKRAEEILSLASNTEQELRSDDTELNGSIRIGSAESDSVRFLMHAARKMQLKYPHLHFHITSGDGQQMMELLDKSLIDIAVVYGHVDTDKYEVLLCPTVDHWGILLRRDNPLSQKEKITPQDLWDEKLIVSNQVLQGDNHADKLQVWLKKPFADLHISATYSLAYNASLMVREGLGSCIMLEKIIRVQEEDDTLCFRLLDPPIADRLLIVWKRFQLFSKGTQQFIQLLKQERGSQEKLTPPTP
ncbi:LysR family transcriptional regulator [Megasphaera sp.]|uniref:LysR family transcriptional regulator n=1 Tax=Megasphaera sp. TaxID=2023260 RepID=UPI0025C1A7DB|nr:LysR family transcriptional regulator [Megasphaera sp.]MCF0153850.1 LysR family transcriptional regulator [Megasphaera sp.]